jgi:L-asparagine transporter-like permease
VTDEDAIVEHATGLHKALTRGKITMMGLGGAIGTGL